MEPRRGHRGQGLGARPRRRRHRPDHPQAVPEAGRAHRASASSSSTTGSATARSSSSRTRSWSPARNFGCGSSREHAPWALQDFGFEAVIAPSFADIFYGNCTKIGLLPVILAEDECRAVAEAGAARIDLDDQTVDSAAGVVRFEIDEEIKHRLFNGLDDIAVTLQDVAAIDAFEAGGHGRPRPRDDDAVSAMSDPVDWDAATYHRVADTAGGVGPRGARPARARRRRDRARRRLRQRAGDAPAAASACPRAG